MYVICVYDTIILFSCIPLVYENKTYILISTKNSSLGWDDIPALVAKKY